jgi:predicted TIM-barrel fold metal-dependent hydrolase
MNKSSFHANIAALLLAAGASGILAADSKSAASPDQLLLKDYRPASLYRLAQTRIEKARFPVIDMHSHAYARNSEQVDQWVKTMDAMGIEKSVVLTGAAGKAFDEAKSLFARHPSRFELWCGIDYAGFDKPGFGPAAIAELERCRKAGAMGVGELSDKGGGLVKNSGSMHLDDPRMDSLLEKCADLGLPINIHVGEDRWMYEPMEGRNDGLMNAWTWRIAKSPDVLSHDAVIATLENAVRKHPRATFIACHFANCCYDLNKLGALLDAYPNLHADISARYAETAPIPRFAARFFARYQDRLVYGTDMGRDPEMYRTTFRILETEDEHFYDWNLFTYHWPLHGFGLPDAVLKKVYAGNAQILMERARKP